MTLRKAVEQAVANAFSAGAQWQAMHKGQDSAAIGRELRKWREDMRYQESLRRQQQAATDSVASAIMRVRLTPEREQAGLFAEELAQASMQLALSNNTDVRASKNGGGGR